MKHPIYAAAAATTPSYDGGPVWIDTADTAKLIRANLARAFPGVKFYVRSDNYSGGSSIDIYFDGVVDGLFVRYDYDGNRVDLADPVTYDKVDHTNGRWGHLRKPGAPSKRDVDAVVSVFAGKGFDGMIDMSFYKDAWLLPDGSAAWGHSDGTVGSMGVFPGYDHAAPNGSAIKVHFGVSHVFVNDDLPWDVRSKKKGN